MARKFLFVAGDLSGDIHASHVARHLKKEVPDATVISFVYRFALQVKTHLDDVIVEALQGQGVTLVDHGWVLFR